TASAVVTVTVTGGSENSVHVINSPDGDGTKVLVVRGSSAGDKIDVKLGSLANTFKIKIKTGALGGSIGSVADPTAGHIGAGGSFHMGTFKFDQSAEAISKVIVYGLDGNDSIKVHSTVGVMGWLFGGNGDDKLRGGKGDDLLVGGAGNDKIDGKAGRDILIGGLGADKMRGKQDEDILIAGSTIYDDNLAALSVIMKEWTSANSFADRVANIFSGSGASSRANGSFFFDNTTVNVSDGEIDKLDGGAGADWFIADELSDGDKVKGFDVGEDIFGLDGDWFNLDP
ncbi:MAG: calcium-binding protein, partial [Pirellulales bacterium]